MSKHIREQGGDDKRRRITSLPAGGRKPGKSRRKKFAPRYVKHEVPSASEPTEGAA